MKKPILVYILFVLLKPVFCYEEPIFHVHDRSAGADYLVKDFFVYNYSESLLQGYARLFYSGTNYRQFVNMTVSLFKNGSLAGSKKTYADFETYGSSGMLPGTETLLNYYLDKVEFDSVCFNISYSSTGINEAKFNKDALTVTNTLISSFSGSTMKAAGIIANLSDVALMFPCIFICPYKDDKMLLYKKTYADAPDNSLASHQTATFSTYIDLPASYDSILYVPNYSPTLTGPVIISSIAHDSNNEVPKDFFLSTNYPNPFNSTTTIEFFLPVESYARLKILDVKGREVATLLDGMQAVGYQAIRWNASGLSSGIYYYSLEAGAFISVKRALLLK
ncbi:T9SS type A sorting domain-containing protein [bacterium]|nr:T9SS type A sorting domain-containing protein [bacterium]